MGYKDKESRIVKMLFTPEDAETDAGAIFVANGVERSDPGLGTQAGGTNQIVMHDEKGCYLPCGVGVYHVHRGATASKLKAMCDCPHEELMWGAKAIGLLLCKQCHRTFLVDGDGGERIPRAIIEDNSGLHSYFDNEPPTDSVQ